MKQKLLIKITDNGDWRWVHLCHVDSKVYQKFKNLPGNESQSIGSHISNWFFQDFGIKLSMVYQKDLFQMKSILNAWYRQEYPELYLKNCPGDTRRIAGIVGIWVTQHMNYEIEKQQEGIK